MAKEVADLWRVAGKEAGDIAWTLQGRRVGRGLLWMDEIRPHHSWYSPSGFESFKEVSERMMRNGFRNHPQY